MNNANLSIAEVGSILMGAGLVKLEDLTIGLGLIASGVLLKIIVAVLNKQNIEVRG